MDALQDKIDNTARLSSECIIFLNWRNLGILPGNGNLYSLPSKLVFSLFALDRETRNLIGWQPDTAAE